MTRRLTLLLVLPFLLLSYSCDEGNPVAPDGSFLILNANPSRISLDGFSQITITGRRPDGNPLSDGTEVRLSTDLGNISPTIVEIDGDGNATATLRADGRPGPAIVTASIGTSGGGGGGEDGGGGGGGVGAATITVQIGEDETTTPTLRVEVNPSILDAGNNSRATVTVVARNADGSPVAAGRTVVLTSTLGSFADDRPETDEDGVATTVYRAGLVSGDATISASIGNSEVATTTVNIRTVADNITVQASQNNVDLQTEPVNVTITALAITTDSQPATSAQVTFSATPDGELTSTVDITDSNGIATTTLVLDPDDLPENQTTVITIRARTPGAGGQFVEDTTTITVTN